MTRQLHLNAFLKKSNDKRNVNRAGCIGWQLPLFNHALPSITRITTSTR